MPQAYKLKKASKLEPKATAGSIVYSLRGYDYGLASDDTRMTGVEHVSVTLNADGDYPSFTIPRADIEPAPKPCSRCGRTVDGMPRNDDGSRRVTICNGFCEKLQEFERFEHVSR